MYKFKTKKLMEKLGESIEDLRQKEGFKRKYQLAKEIGIGESYYSKISTGSQDPSLETLEISQKRLRYL